MEIIPAILTDSSDKFKELVKKLEPYTDRIHIDVADGDLVPNKTISGYEELKDLELSVKFDIHLMVTRPQDIIDEWLNIQADRFIIHAESDVGLDSIVKKIKNQKKEVGIALNPETGVEEIEEYFGDISFVQFMTIHPGFQGQPFLDTVVDKIASFHNKYPDIIIMCDGGIIPERISKLVKAGASVLVSGSYIIKSSDFEKAINELKKSCTT